MVDAASESRGDSRRHSPPTLNEPEATTHTGETSLLRGRCDPMMIGAYGDSGPAHSHSLTVLVWSGASARDMWPFASFIIRFFRFVLFFSAETVFFSHHKSVETVLLFVFFSAKRTGPRW